MKNGNHPRFPAWGILLMAATLFLIDQVTKGQVLQVLKPTGQPVTLIPGLLEFTYVENRAAAMGLFAGMIWLVVAVTVAVCGAIVVSLWRYKGHTALSLSACALLLAGGLGNLADRFQYGYVVDFIHVMFFDYVFNVADCCVTIGAVCFVLHYIVAARREKAREQAAPPKEG